MKNDYEKPMIDIVLLQKEDVFLLLSTEGGKPNNGFNDGYEGDFIN